MRIVAGLIDGIIVLGINLVVGVIIGVIMGATTTAIIIASIVGLIISVAYTGIEYLKAQTPGKMMFKMIVRQQDGSPARQDQLMKRVLFKLSPTIVGVVLTLVGAVGAARGVQGLLGLLVLISALMCARESKLALHDEWFGTAVYGPGGEPAGFPVGQAPPPPPAV